ncbi:peroxide stress protein YaaA [Bifidobacterium bombi]|uniref:UPF0246 protein BBOMB_0387 n=1 Tax=Bifidobacterium bombi DSM 19703 TaxID=1341695 RepID=A0A080N2J5_9BIFI|nr:peroxide stress protein YaaA [Bifidobacterium bombi]KFF31056.1 hypothetical protein BBOMB_0387 [Bifidobacterium bombi DSM 19703]
MLVIVSPSKTLDFLTPLSIETYTVPALQNEAEELIESCRKLSCADIQEFMGVSAKLANLTYRRFQDWSKACEPGVNARQALFAFSGKAYESLHARDFSEEDLVYAQDHLRILSGLYGALRPLDIIEPYRLDMGSRIPLGGKTGPCGFWKRALTEHLNTELASHHYGTLIDLASREYFSALRAEAVNARIIQPIFMDRVRDEYRIVSFRAKQARGLMSRYIIRNRLEDETNLRRFDWAGYRYDVRRSDEYRWVFIREAEGNPE